MAPQQNSTFIDDDSKLRQKFPINQSTKEYDEEEEIIKRCSPILAPIDDDDGDDQLNGFDGEYDREIIKKQKQVSYRQTQPKAKNFENMPKKYIQNNCKQFQNGNYAKKHPEQSCRSQRTRSISLHGANSTIDQGHTEITIWIGDEARYVSGVTKKTTCSDIVKALIDDEIQNGNKSFFQDNKRDGRDNDVDVKANEYGNGDGVCATSRDYSDYVITESWRGIERGYDGNITILPVWKAWSRVHNEFRLRLRHRRDIQDPIQLPKVTECQQICHGQRQNLLKKCLNKLRRLWRKQKPLTSCGSTSKAIELKENCLLSKKDHIPDEFLFVILPDKMYEKETEKYAKQMRKKPPNASTSDQQTKQCEHRRSHARMAKASRKKQERAVNSCIRRRQHTTAMALNSSLIQNTVRFRLAKKTSEMDDLYAREYALTRELSEKCKLYRLQNQIYSNPDQQWNVSIGQVQRKIENYAREIVRTEHELLELKNEIRQDISLINNLKRMSLARNDEESKKCRELVPSTVVMPIESVPKETPSKTLSPEMQFVDNIYEFCDNNASMLV